MKPPTIPGLEKQISPAALIEVDPEGNLLVSLRPRIYLDGLGCVTVSDSEGNAFSQMHYVIAFSLKKIRHWTIWGVTPGEGPPVKLDPAIDYKCLIKTLDPSEDGETVPCVILKIWDGADLIYKRKAKAE